MISALKDRACGCPDMLRGPAFGGMTFRPTRDDARRCGVCVPSMAAGLALKAIAGRPVGAADRSAARACLTRVLRIDRDHRDASKRRLVGQEQSQLGERPTVVRAALGLPNRCPLANALEVFKADTAIGVSGFPHDSLGDAMVHIGCEPALFQPAPLEKPQGRFGPLLLELSAQPVMAIAQARDMCAAERLAIAVRGNVLLAEVNAEIPGRITGRHVAHVNHDVEIELTVSIDQVGLSADATELRALICAANPRHQQAPVKRQDRDAIRPLPGQNALVIDDGAVRSERRLDRLVALIDLNDFRDGAHSHLRGEIKFLSHRMVSQFLQLELVGAFVLERNPRKVVAGGVEPFHRREQRRCLFRRRKQFGLHRQVHIFLYRKPSMRRQALPRCARPAIPPGPEGPGFTRRFR